MFQAIIEMNREHKPELPEDIRNYHASRGIRNFICTNRGLLSNWREAREQCAPDIVHSLLLKAATTAKKDSDGSDLRVCLGLGLFADFNQKLAARTIAAVEQTSFTELLLDAPLAVLKSLREDRYLPILDAGVPKYGRIKTERQVERILINALSLLTVNARFSSNRLREALNFFDLTSDAVQLDIVESINLLIAEIAHRCEPTDSESPVRNNSGDIAFKIAQLINACTKLHAVSTPPDGAATLLHALAKNRDVLSSDPKIMPSLADQECYWAAIEKMTARDPATGRSYFNVDAYDDQDLTALHEFVLRDNERGCAMLCAAGADANIVDRAFVSPLHVAVKSNNAVMVNDLMAAGADSLLKDCNGITPEKRASALQASTLNATECLQIIQSWKVKRTISSVVKQNKIVAQL